MRKLIATTAVLTGLVGTTLVTEPAGATYSQGVKTISYAHSTDSCAPAQFGCTPGAGEGAANVIRITQVDTFDGGRAFGAHETTAQLSGNLWMAATLGAECRAGYSLESARIRLGSESHTFQEGKVPEQVHAWNGDPVSVPNAKTMPSKKLAVNIPLSVVLPSESVDGADAYGDVLDFGSIDNVYAYGEHVVDQRIANGMTETQARSQAFSFTTHIPTHAEVRCQGNGPAARTFVKALPQWLPLNIQYMPDAPTPGSHHAIGGGKRDAIRVTHAGLTVLADPDSCTLHLSGTIVADGATTVTYRFIDKYGQLSNGFQTAVLANHPTLVSHEVAIPTGPAQLDGPALAPNPGGAGGPSDELVGDLPGGHWGTYQLQVETPNEKLSNVAGFEVPYCEPASTPGQALPQPGQVTKAPQPTHG